MFSDQKLPPLDTLSAAHSDLVAAAVCRKINQRGSAIRFDEFMRSALYEPGLGLLRSRRRKVWSKG